MLVSEAAADMWEDVLSGPGVYSWTIRYNFTNGLELASGASNEVLVRSNFDDELAGKSFFFDQTPFLNEEFTTPIQEIYRDAPSSVQSDFAGVVPATFETGFHATGNTVASGTGTFDLLTVMLHEMGHLLGFDFSVPNGNIVLPAQFGQNLNGVQVEQLNDVAHIAPDNALINPTLDEAERRLISALDVILAAHLDGIPNVDLDRVDWFGDSTLPMSQFWSVPSAWEGGAEPDSETDVTIRNGYHVSVWDPDPARAASLRLLEDASLVVTSTLAVGGTITVVGGTAFATRLDVGDEGVLTADSIFVDRGELSPSGSGKIFADSIVITPNINSRLAGNGLVEIGTELVNDGVIEADEGLVGGTLVISNSTSELDLDGSTEQGQVRVVKGDLNLAAPFLEEFNSRLTIGNGYTLFTQGTWEIGNGANVIFTSDTAAPTKSGTYSAGGGVFGGFLTSGSASVQVSGSTEAHILADGILISEDTDATVDPGSTLIFDGTTTLHAGVSGGGDVIQNKDLIIAGDSVVIVANRFDWDGKSATPSNTEILADKSFTILANDLGGTTEYRGNILFGSDASLDVDLTGVTQEWTLAQNATMTMDNNGDLLGDKLNLNGTLKALGGENRIFAPISINATASVQISDATTLALRDVVAYAGGEITTKSGTMEGSMLSQYTTGTVTANQDILVGYFNWDAADGPANASDTVLKEGNKLSVTTRQVGNNDDRYGFADIVVIEGDAELHIDIVEEAGIKQEWQLNPTGVIDMQNTAIRLPIVSGDKLVSYGTIKGSGEFQNFLENFGLMEVGYANGIGYFNMLEDFTQDKSGKLRMELSGLVAATEFDAIFTEADALLAGELEIALLGGYMPVKGDRFRIVQGGTFSSFSGMFDTLDLPTLTGGETWEIVYGLEFVELVVVPEPGTVVLVVMGLGAAVSARRFRVNNVKLEGRPPSRPARFKSKQGTPRSLRSRGHPGE